MTSALAHRLQWWFTSCMPTITSRKPRRETIYDKAARLMSEPERIHTIAAHGQDYWIGTVEGDHGTYKACAVTEEQALAMGFGEGRTACRCRAGRFGRVCAHSLVAEEMRLRGNEGGES